MVRAIAQTRPDEIDCDEFFAQMDLYAELVLAGKPAAEALPFIQEHLERCPDCKEEFEALLEVLRHTP